MQKRHNNLIQALVKHYIQIFHYQYYHYHFHYQYYLGLKFFASLHSLRNFEEWFLLVGFFCHLIYVDCKVWSYFWIAVVPARSSRVHMENERICWLHRTSHGACMCRRTPEPRHCPDEFPWDCRDHNLLVSRNTGRVLCTRSHFVVLHGGTSRNAGVGFSKIKTL